VAAVAAADWTGPAAGARGMAMTPGAFAERVAVDAAALAVLPPP
jgi:NADPH:quinone reductase-like Zn-dependent oxidoreductase